VELLDHSFSAIRGTDMIRPNVVADIHLRVRAFRHLSDSFFSDVSYSRSKAEIRKPQAGGAFLETSAGLP
jgi:hypothetical protein